MRRKYFLHCIMLGAVLFAGGCAQITVEHAALGAPSRKYNDKINVYIRAEGRAPVNIAKVTFPWAAWIPAGMVRSQIPINKQVMIDIKSVLDNIGYETTVIRSRDARTAPAVKCTLKKFAFKTYTMFFPGGWRSGDICLDIELIAPDGRVLWQDSFQDSSFVGGLGGFEEPVKMAMTKLLNELTEAFSSEDFHKALLAGMPPIQNTLESNSANSAPAATP